MKKVSQEKPLLTLIVPVYNEESSLNHFYDQTCKCTESMGVEIEFLFINDGSEDNTLEMLRQLCRRDSRVRYLSFSRNFGKEAAMYAGLQYAGGDYAAIMDADLQDPPELLPKMYDAVVAGDYDCAAARRVNRKGEGKIRSFCADCFYKIMTRLSGMNLMPGARDFQLMNRKMINAVLSLKEKSRFSKGIFEWVGFRKKWVEYENVERSSGCSKWSFGKLCRYALDGITSFSTLPLQAAFIPGMICWIAAVALLAVEISRFYVLSSDMRNWLLLFSFLMCLSGTQFFCMGIFGKYLGKTYEEVKHRPVYVMDECHLSERTEENEDEQNAK